MDEDFPSNPIFFKPSKMISLQSARSFPPESLLRKLSRQDRARTLN